MRAMTEASPDSAIQRNGPIARANSGLRYASVKIGIANASATPASLACVRIRLPLSNTSPPRLWNASIACTCSAIEARLAAVNLAGSVFLRRRVSSKEKSLGM